MRSDEKAYRTVSQAAEEAGVTRKAIRVYEERGLLPPPERTEAGYRLFSGDDVAVLRFIRQARTLGLSLSEIGEILDLQRGGTRPCTYVIGLLDAHLAQIESTLSELRALEASLRTARSSADAARRSGQDAIVCHIIEQNSPDRALVLGVLPAPGLQGFRADTAR